MARNRVIYQSEALFVGPKAGGEHSDHKELHRVQSISHDMSATRTDIFEFGRLASLDKVMIEAPTVSLDFGYLLTNGENEKNIGLVVEQHTNGYVNGNYMGSNTLPNATSGIVANPGADNDEKNYYVVTVPEGLDADDDDSYSSSTNNFNSRSIVGFGNGVLSNYSINGAVGDFASASVSIEAFNVSFISGQDSSVSAAWVSGDAIPTVKKGTDSLQAGTFALPAPGTGEQNVFAIRPGDIILDFGLTDSNAFSQLNVGGAILPSQDPDTTQEGAGDPEPMHLQNFSIEMPLARTALTRLGSTFPYYRAIDFPLNVTLNCSALLADVSTGSLVDIMCNDTKRTIEVALRNPCTSTVADGAGLIQTRFRLKNAQLVSQNFSASIGDNKTVDLTFEATVGGPTDLENGLFISGTAAAS
jgi:hypothetical protein